MQKLADMGAGSLLLLPFCREPCCSTREYVCLRVGFAAHLGSRFHSIITGTYETWVSPNILTSVQMAGTEKSI